MAESEKIDWNNFEKVADILEDFAGKAKNGKQSKDANEALGQLLGVSDNVIFQKMNSDQQNQFLQSVVDSHSQHGLTSSQVAQKLLEGLHLRTPQLAPATPAPVYGMAMAPPVPGLAPGGGGGGARPQQQQQNQQPPPAQQTQQGEQWPPPYVPVDKKDED
jgi:hypothetical protein